MQLTLMVGCAEVRKSVEAAEKVDVDQLGRMLNAPLDGVLTGQIDEAWTIIRSGLLSAVKRGSAAAEQVAGEVWSAVNGLMTAAGARAQLVEDMLLERLRRYADALQANIMARIQDSLTVGSRTLPLQSIQVTQEVHIQGSLKASITELVALSSEGKMQLSAVYAITKL